MWRCIYYGYMLYYCNYSHRHSCVGRNLYGEVHYIYYTLQLYIYEIAAFAAMTVGVSSYIKLISVCVIAYAVGLKFAPEFLPFQNQPNDDFYAPHSSCFPEPEF